MKALLPHERALIDAAIAEGRVTVVPRGVSGLPLPVWVELPGTKGKLVYPDGARMFRQTQAAHWTGTRAARPPHPHVLARRDVVARMHGEGMTVAEIVARTGQSEAIVRQDLAKMDLRCHRAPHPSAARAIGRRDRVREMVERGDGAEAIASAEGLSLDRVFRLCRQMGLALQRPASLRISRLRAEIDADVARLVAQGLTKKAIREAAQISHETLRLSLRRQGLDAPKAGKVGRLVGPAAARVAAVRDLAAQGLTRVEIAERLNLQPASVRELANRHGIEVRHIPGRGVAVRDRVVVPRPRPAEALRQRIAALYDQGLSWREIGAACGVGSGTVGYHLQMLGKAKVRNPKGAAA